MNPAERAELPTPTDSQPGRSLRPVSVASAVMGLNSNVSVRGVVYHIQTEDLGLRSAQVVTHVFVDGGQVVKVARVDYARHLDKPGLRVALPKVMKAHHALVARKLASGELDSVAVHVSMAAPVRASSSVSLVPPPTLPSPQLEPSSLRRLPTISRESLVELAQQVPVGPKSIPPIVVENEEDEECPPSRVVSRAELMARTDLNPVSSSPAASTPASPEAASPESATPARPTTPAAKVWNQLVEAARRDRGREAWVKGVRGATGADEARSGVAPSRPRTPTPPASRVTSSGGSPSSEVARASLGSLSDAPIPGSATDFHRQGIALLKGGEKVEALVCLSRAVQLDPTNSRFHRSLRHCLDAFDSD